MKVDFLICGAQKSGTSALDFYLRQHPDICMANQKEVHFFDNENIFSSSRPNYQQYHSFFSPSSPNRIIGESTPIYMYWNEAPRRIWEYNPAMKVIILLRNPLERAYSHWNMEVSRGNETLNFYDAIKNELTRAQEALPYQHRIYSYSDRGFYSSQIRRIWQFFTKNQVLILKQEELKTSPNIILRKVADFLEIRPFKEIKNKEIHAMPYEVNMDRSSKDFLNNLFLNEIRQIESMLGWNCSSWIEN